MWARIKNSVPVNLLLMLAAIAVGIGAVRMVRETLGLRLALGDTEEKLDKIQRQKAEAASRLAELETPEVIEREAKAKLNLKKFGEEVVVVVPEELHEPPPARSWWERIEQFFAGIF